MTRLPDFPIPEEVTPENRVCVQFTIPDNQAYRQIVLGWMNQLCYSFNWQRDETHNAVICSNLFKQSREEMIASLTEGCTGNDMYFKMRISPENGCISEAQYEPDGEWIPFMNQCCCDSNQVKEYRISPTDGTIEVSTDGGVTYEEDASSIYAMSIEPVPLAGDDGNVKRCEAANNVVDNLKDVQAGISAKLGLTYTLYDFAVAILVEICAIVLVGLTGGLTIIPLVVALIPKIIETARAIFGLSQAAYDGLFTETVWTTTRCIVYCNVQANGKFTAGGWSAIKTQLAAQLGSGSAQAGSNLASMVDVWALTGLNHAAAYGAGSEGNCDDCPCGSCDFSAWEQWENGVVLEQDETHIKIQAVFGSGQWNAGIRNVNINDCCCNVEFAVGEGELITVIGYVPCGMSNDDQSNMLFAYSGQLANGFALAGTSAFTVTITGNGEGDCE